MQLKKQTSDNVAITFLLGLLGLIIVGVYNTAFKKGFFTCQHYVLNTYLYILMALVIISLMVLGLDINNIDLSHFDLSKHMGRIMSIIVTLFLIIGILIVTMSINPRLVILKHLCWLVLLGVISFMAYPSYLRSKDNNTLRGVLLSLVAILVIFTVVVFIKPELVSFSWGPVLFFLLVGVIISHLIFMATSNKRSNTQNKNYMKYSSYFIIVLFIFFIMYDTKLIIVGAKLCQEKTADYINQSLGIVIDALNLFSNLSNVMN